MSMRVLTMGGVLAPDWLRATTGGSDVILSIELDLLEGGSDCSSVRSEMRGRLSSSPLGSLESDLLLIVGTSGSGMDKTLGEPVGLVFTTSCLDTSVK